MTGIKIEKNRIKNAVLSLLTVMLFLTACSRPEVPEYARVKRFENRAWSRSEQVRFKYRPQSAGAKNVFIFLENTTDYPYSNIFLIAKMQQGNKIQIDTFEYEMAEGNGKWLGRKVKNTYENLLVYRLNWPVKDTAEIIFELEPATRPVDQIEGDSLLKGVASVGIIVEPVKENSNRKNQ